MDLNTVLEKDSSLSLVAGTAAGYQVEGITTISEPKPNRLFFLKEYRFYKHWLASLDRAGADAWNDSVAIVSPAIWNNESYRSMMIESVNRILLAEDIDVSICLLSEFFYRQKYGHIDPLKDGRESGSAQIDPTALIGPGVFIGEGVIIKAGVQIHAGTIIMAGCRIKENTEIFPSVTLYNDVEIGSECRIHSGCVIGADGFGYKNIGGEHRKIWHTGSVIIGDRVEIGAMTSIDGGTFSPTTVGDGTIIDNQVQIGHNGKIGKGVILCGQVGISGSVEIGDYTVCGGKAGIGNDIRIGKQCQIAGNAMVTNSCPDKSVLGGHPARPLREWMRELAFLKKQVKQKA